MSDSSAFSGLKLSEQAAGAPSTPVDQRLFGLAAKPAESQAKALTAPPSRTTAPPAVTAPMATPTDPSALSSPARVGKEGNRERGKPEIPLESARAERPLTDPSSRTVSRFDINEKPWRKDSFLFTDSEFDRLEDLKLELRRRFEFNATKNDIARAAFQCLYEDYTRDPARSAIVRHLRHKKT